jgi:cytochrome c oxidase assembly protein subunit 15
LAAVFTLPLLFAGGSVTTYRVGLAVPDWPTTFGINMFLYDFWNASFGVRVEHTHRLYGAAVGLATVILAAWFLVFERRPFLKVLGVVALAAVIIQGVLGGFRVWEVSTLLAAVHGCTGQAFFGLLVALCVLTGKDWQTAGARRPALVAGQILVGSWVRHYASRSGLVAHAFIACAIWILALGLVTRLRRGSPGSGALRASAWALTATTTLQVLLGVVSFVCLLPFDGYPRAVTFYQAVVRTSHQTNAAFVLASAVALALRAYRHLGSAAPNSVPSHADPVDGATARVGTVPDWEAAS